ncbi:MAG: hypothetical protein AAF662_13355 [Pseudomonadota bacterium]
MKLVPEQLSDWKQFGKNDRWGLLKRVFAPIVMRSQECLLYPSSDNSDQSLYRSSSQILIKDGKRYRLDRSRNCFDDAHRDLWIDWEWNRGSIVCTHDIDEQFLTDIFAHCFDPIAMENPSTYLGNNVVALTRRRASEDRVACFALPSGVEHLFVFAGEREIGELYDLALSECGYSESFRLCYGD